MSNYFAQAVPFVSWVVKRILINLSLFLVVILYHTVAFLYLVKLLQHIIHLIQHAQILDDSLLFWFVFLREWLPANILVLAHECSDVLVLVLNDWALAFPELHFLAELPVAFGEVQNLPLEWLLVFLFQLLAHDPWVLFLHGGAIRAVVTPDDHLFS